MTHEEAAACARFMRFVVPLPSCIEPLISMTRTEESTSGAEGGGVDVDKEQELADAERDVVGEAVAEAIQTPGVGRIRRVVEGDGRTAEVVELDELVVGAGEHLVRAGEIERLHDAAHHNCFIANSIVSKIRIEPQRVLQAL